MRRPPTRAIVAGLVVVLLGGVSLVAQVGFDRLLGASREPHNWLTYSGDLNGRRYSALTSITPANVKHLQLEWVLQTPAPAETTQKHEATSHRGRRRDVHRAAAERDRRARCRVRPRLLDVSLHAPAPTARACCGRVNRGLAILGHRLFMGTIDGNLIAIDARDGRLLWTTPVGRPEAGYAVTAAPLVVKDKVIVGPAGGEFGISGFLAAYDAATGKAGLEVQHGAPAGRTRQRDVGRRLVAPRQRIDLEHRHLRSDDEH